MSENYTREILFCKQRKVTFANLTEAATSININKLKNIRGKHFTLQFQLSSVLVQECVRVILKPFSLPRGGIAPVEAGLNDGYE